MVEGDSKKRRPLKRRRAILEAALAAFEAHGYDALTVEHIRQRSGASIGSIYHHFGGKAGIAASLYEAGLVDYQRGLLAAITRARTARTLIEGIVRYHLHWAEANPAWARYLLRTRQLDAVAAIEVRLRERNVSFLEQALAVLQPYVERGEITRLPAEIWLALVLGPAQEFLRLWLWERTDVPLEPARRLLAAAAWKAVQPAADRR